MMLQLSICVRRGRFLALACTAALLAVPLGPSVTSAQINLDRGGPSSLVGVPTAPADPVDAADQPATQDRPAPTLATKEELAAVLAKVEDTLEEYRAKAPNTRSNDPWEIMHWIVGNGIDSQVLVGGPEGDPMTAIGWLCFNAPAAGRRLLTLDGDGVEALRGTGRQGHDGQFLAILAQAKVMRDYPLHVEAREFTVEDLVEFEKRTCLPGTELTFKLIGLSNYLDTDATWVSETGAPWSIERLIAEEIDQPIIGATCGGSHRLFGLSYAVYRRRREDKSVDGQFARADKYVADYREYTLGLQNDDGSFSTNWAGGPGASSSRATRLYTTGHTLEWVAFSATSEGVADARLVRAVDYLCDLLGDTNVAWDIGTLGHALHGLSIYHQRAASLLAGDDAS